ncbi:serine/threonine-protein phosphatase 4 regulatory subunit 3-like [Papaver somniferum]|uniref:serine/threonine-protein phosphatase 4 regulatory subunit 3-like n=1 Tax=Papaver somniferum TaxID=3469 RepID=UPI000E6FA172|nr:serine/threonine-protein phosphatase 4 regulatory subunit 3-like [Papaver somniferum]
MGTPGKTDSSSSSSSSSESSMQRVKVYHLNEDGKWDDRGTGHVSVDYLERSEDLGIFVSDEEDNEPLLAHPIRADEIYRRQEDTIISWRDPEYNTELALSFQEPTGCSYIWEQICNVRRNMQYGSIGDLDIGPRPATDNLDTSGGLHSNDDTFHSTNSELRDFPAVELSTLPLILKTVLDNSITDQMRVTELLLHDQSFFPKLIDLFKICEDLENLDGLHMIFKLVKGIILLNSPHIFDKIFGDEFIMDIIGCLEYDPELPHIQHHRAFLKEQVVYKEAIPIKDPTVLSKIHQTYRVGYIKDVILPRILDEGTTANLNSIVHTNNATVISFLKDHDTFIQELFAKMRSPTTSTETKKNLVFFLREFCVLSKSLQMVNQLRLFRDLMNEGIFDIITDALRTQDNKLVLTGTDILILFLNQDPNLLRTYITRPEGNALLGLLVTGMTTDFGEDMHCQFLEILRSLLDSYTFSGSQRDTAIIEIFYEKHLDQLIDVIRSSCPPNGTPRSSVKSNGCCEGKEIPGFTKPEILSNICELLCFCVLHHPYRMKCKILLNNIVEKVLYLTRRRERYIVVAAIRFLRTVISRNDDQLLQHVVKNNLLKPVVTAFVGNGSRYNLLYSAVLELVEFIRKENYKSLVLYLVESSWNELVKFESLKTFEELKKKYDQYMAPPPQPTGNNIPQEDLRKRNDERAPEKEEEEYFNEDSDEEDTASAQPLRNSDPKFKPVLANGDSLTCVPLRPGSAGLVDYEDDEDDEDYNPPPRSLPESSSGDERIENSSPKSRRSSSSDEEHELTKKQRTEETLISTACSTCSLDPSPPGDGKATINSLSGLPQTCEENCNSDAGICSEKESTVPKSPPNCLSNTTDSKQPGVENCQLMIPNVSSSSDVAVNGSNVPGSEPYSVR